MSDKSIEKDINKVLTDLDGVIAKPANPFA